MAEPQPNGLASLSTQRQRARRSMPPPRHPVAVSAPAKADKARDEDPQVARPPIDAPVTAGSSSNERIQPLSAAEVGAPVKVTLYVDRQADDFMEAARVEGLVARPKVDISRSAVVRLALRRLMSDMTASQVKALLESQEVRSTGPGRKRR